MKHNKFFTLFIVGVFLSLTSFVFAHNSSIGRNLQETSPQILMENDSDATWERMEEIMDWMHAENGNDKSLQNRLSQNRFHCLR